MIRAIVWKELREQGLIGLTLLVVGSGLLAATAAFADPPTGGAGPTDVIRYLGLGRLATLMLAVTAGVVSGGALFAAEWEAGTMSFLNSLPVSRWRLWKAKLIAGLLLALTQIGAVLIVSASLGLLESGSWARSVAAEALLAFTWGAFGSTFSRTTLGSIGFAIPFAAAAAFVFAIPVMILFSTSGGLPRSAGSMVFLGLMLATPLLASAVAFTRADRLRLADAVPHMAARTVDPEIVTNRYPEIPAEVAVSGTRPRIGLRALAWLTFRQVLVPAFVTSAFAVAFGLTLLLPDVLVVMFWPMLALVAGVIAGVTTFAPEQGREVYRFWSENRLPLGRLWLMKIGMHLLLVAWLLFLLALPLFVREELLPATSPFQARTTLGTIFRSRLFDELHFKAWHYLLVPAGYGFAAGHLFGLLFRKPVVAAGVAGVVGGSLAIVGTPSLLGGGVSLWQAWGPAVLMLLLGRVVLRAWTTDRLLHRGSIRSLALGGVLILVTMAGGLGYRVLEVPRGANAEADVALMNTLPPMFEDNGGRDFGTAVSRFARIYGIVNGLGAPGGAITSLDPQPMGTSPNGTRKIGPESLDHVVVRGWPTEQDEPTRFSPRPAELEAWLNELFDGEMVTLPELSWHEQAAAAAKRPLGVFADPRQLSIHRPPYTLDQARFMGTCLLVHGLQQQAKGNPAPFLDDLATVLKLVQTLKFGSVVQSYLTAVGLERSCLLACDRWMQKFRGPPDQLRRALALWQEMESGKPFDPRPYYLADRYVLREAMMVPSQWLPEMLVFPSQDKDKVEPEANLVSVAWSVPWERERSRRLVGLGNDDDRRMPVDMVRGRPGAFFFQPRSPSPERLIEIERRSRTACRAMILKLSLMLYEAAHGRPADQLEQLLGPNGLRELPLDPYAEGRTFQYRVSAGERIDPYPVRGPGGGREGRPRGGLSGPPGGPDRPRLSEIPAGQGILWSIGPDGINAEGRAMIAPSDSLRLHEDDLTFLVPMWQRP